MSARAMEWAWRQKLDDPTTKFLLIKLADQANDDGECWPSKATLATSLCVSADTVKRHAKKLEQAGLVQREPRSKGRQTSNLYLLQLGGAPVHPLDDPRGGVDAPPRGGAGAPPEVLRTSEPSEGPLATGVAERPRNIVWDILVEHFGAPSTTSEQGDFGKTVTEIRGAMGFTGRVDDPAIEAPARREIAARVEAMGEERYRTHRRLRTQWSELGRRVETPADEVGSAIRAAADQEWEACPCGTDEGWNPHCPECGGTGKYGYCS